MADQTLIINGKSAASGSGVINILPFDFISGLSMQYVSATALTVTTGAACRPSDGQLVQPAANIAKTGLSLAASTWYHVYLWLNGATPDIEIVTTAPAAPYFGTARAKTGDTSRRYLGSVLTNSTGALYNFLHVGNGITYQAVAQDVPFRVLSNGQAIVKTDVSVSGIVPSTARVAVLSCNLTSNTSVRLGNANDGGATVVDSIYAFKSGATVLVPMPLTSALTFNYGFGAAPTTGALIVDVTAYTFER